MNTTSQKQRVLNALLNGEELTAKQIGARFSAGNPRDVIFKLRQEGYAIYANKRMNKKGEEKVKYRLGSPTRSLVAAGYQARIAGIA